MGPGRAEEFAVSIDGAPNFSERIGIEPHASLMRHQAGRLGEQQAAEMWFEEHHEGACSSCNRPPAHTIDTRQQRPDRHSDCGTGNQRDGGEDHARISDRTGNAATIRQLALANDVPHAARRVLAQLSGHEPPRRLVQLYLGAERTHGGVPALCEPYNTDHRHQQTGGEQHPIRLRQRSSNLMPTAGERVNETVDGADDDDDRKADRQIAPCAHE